MPWLEKILELGWEGPQIPSSAWAGTAPTVPGAPKLLQPGLGRSQGPRGHILKLQQVVH